MSRVATTTRDTSLVGCRIWKLQQVGQRGCPGMVHGGPYRHLQSFQVQVPCLTTTTEDDAQKLVYFARDFLTDRLCRFFSSGASASATGRAWQTRSLTSTSSWLSC